MPEVSEDCWIWDNPNYGYGPYRLIYTNIMGEPPAKTVLDHLCGVKVCCNPAHLEPVSNATNLRRAAARGRKPVDLDKLPQQELVKTKDISNAFNVSQEYIRVWIKEGKLKPVNPDRASHSIPYLFRRSDVEALALARMEQC